MDRGEGSRLIIISGDNFSPDLASSMSKGLRGKGLSFASHSQAHRRSSS